MSEVLNNLIQRYPDVQPCLPDIRHAYEILKEAYEQGNKVLVCGNGGSAADSEHIVGELMKGFMKKRPIPSSMRERLSACLPNDQAAYMSQHLQGALPAISLTSHTALITAFANDVAADLIFAQQVYGYGKPGDVLIGLSTSGNSSNVLYAFQLAKAMGLKTIGFIGRDGGKIKDYSDAAIVVDTVLTPDIQERHLPIYHAICVLLEDSFFCE